MIPSRAGERRAG